MTGVNSVYLSRRNVSKICYLKGMLPSCDFMYKKAKLSWFCIKIEPLVTSV